MSKRTTAYSTDDLKRILIYLKFQPGKVTSDGESIEYIHPTKTREFSRNNVFYLPIDNVINRRYAARLLDDLLSFGFSHQEVIQACGWIKL